MIRVLDLPTAGAKRWPTIYHGDTWVNDFSRVWPDCWNDFGTGGVSRTAPFSEVRAKTRLDRNRSKSRAIFNWFSRKNFKLDVNLFSFCGARFFPIGTSPES